MWLMGHLKGGETYSLPAKMPFPFFQKNFVYCFIYLDNGIAGLVGLLSAHFTSELVCAWGISIK